jgi:hypothetical protein
MRWGNRKTAFLPLSERVGSLLDPIISFRQGSRAMMIPEELCFGKDDSVVELALKLEQFVRSAAFDGQTLHDVEQKVLGSVLELGRRCVDLFIGLQGDGDLGTTVRSDEGRELHRSEEAMPRTIRTVFGTHSLSAYVYAPGPKKKIALRPIDARMGLPEGEYSYLLEEFSQYFCIEQAFDKARQGIEKVLGQNIPVNSLERISRRVAPEAEVFLDNLAAPPAEEEGELLVLTADGKGVPMLRREIPKLPVFDESKRRGNRQMATLACVYSVDRFVRSAEEVVAGLFRDEGEQHSCRPRPCHKRMVARFGHAYESDDETIVVSSVGEAMTWGAFEVRRRRQIGQPLIRVCDGQESLWTAGDAFLEPEDQDTIDILDIVHVTKYVWLAAKAFCGANREQAEAFARDRLLRILQGDVSGVVFGLRQMATKRRLRSQTLKDVTTACHYLENNAERMRYDEYLAEGYPIASGVIEGACRHLVKDRMERSGMRWGLTGAESILTLRALSVSDQWDRFQQHRITADQTRLHPHRHHLQSYIPPDLTI